MCVQRTSYVSLLPPNLFECISTYEGDAFDSTAIEDALRRNDCDAIMNTAGNQVWGGANDQILGKIATSVSSAAIRLGRERSRVLRAWFIGGMGSLEYPGIEPYQLQDYLLSWMSEHHRQTEEVLQNVPKSELEWSLLCVALMRPESERVELLSQSRQHGLAVEARKPPEWQDSRLRCVPLLGLCLNIFVNVWSYTTKLEDVADLLAEDFEKASESPFVGELVGMKERRKIKTT